MIYQQGDVILERVDELKGERLNHLVVARGEVTGHCHQVTKGGAELYRDERGALYLRVASDTAELTHEEHRSITLPEGNWLVRKVLEYDHFLEEARRVRD